jgi:hypothetical protein
MRKKLTLSVWLLALVSLHAGGAAASSYYVSTAGSDSASGSSSAPWRTLARVNAVTLKPGDAVMLRGGDTFTGGLQFDETDAGSPSAPIVITSYGTGRATIASGAGAGIYVHNAAGYRISNLAVVGGGAYVSGVWFLNELAGGVLLPYVHVDSVEASGYGRDGIEIGSWNGATGFRDIEVRNAVAHDNGRTGIFVYAQQPNVHQSVVVTGARAFNNSGVAGSSTNSGSGIVVAGVNGGSIERSVAHGNGWRCDAREGPVGIWTYDSTFMRIRHNESYGNRTAGPADGGGFDLDQNVSMSVVEYNYSHDNDGAGYLLAHAPLNDAHYGNTVRYNISQNDGRRNGYAAIEIWGRTRAAEIHNNTVFISPASSGTPRAVRVWNGGITDHDVAGLHFRNNIFQTTGSVPLVEVGSTQLAGATDIRFQGNDYFTSGGGFGIYWGTTVYASLSSWRGVGQEMTGSTAVGRSIDPMLNAAGQGGTLDDATRLETLDAYRFKAGSALVDAGLNLASLFSVDPGPADFYGTPLGGALDVGAFEQPAPVLSATEIVMYARDATATAGAWSLVTDATAAGSMRMQNPDAGAAKLTTPLASPGSHFEMRFTADAGRGYRLWLRGKAAGDSWQNDSAYIQFSDSVDPSGTPMWRIGSTSATTFILEECGGCGLTGWGWQDDGDGAGVLGPLVYFAQSGLHTMRIQTREDGLSIDQIVLSARNYLNAAPGAARNDATILPLLSALPEVVIYASDVPATGIHGDWIRVTDATAANGTALYNPDRGAAKLTSPLASPGSFVDVSFSAQPGVPYHLWLRLRASGNSSSNDSVFVQFSGAVDAAGLPIDRIGTPGAAAVVLQDSSGASISGWGWNDNGWQSFGADLYFAATGTQTLRLQPREDGVFIDQIVLSPARYLRSSPGRLTSDATIVTR